MQRRTIGEIIRDHREDILRSWTRAAGEADSSRGLTPPQLAGMLPAYLELLGRGEAGGASLSDAQHELIERHLSNRLRQGFVLSEILREFAALARCLSSVLDRVGDAERPSVGDVARLFDELYLTVAEVGKIFNEHMLEDEQTEKRYRRLIQQISAEIGEGHEGANKRRQRLQEALALVMHGVGADGAALLLHDHDGRHLLMSASAGPGADELERYATSLDPASFTGATASAPDAEARELEVNEALSASGIQSLLAVRLSPQHLLRGLIIVGVREKRTFTASEARRIEGLAAELVVYLDNAHLRAALREKELAMDAERELRDRFVSVLMHDLTGPLNAARARVGELSKGGRSSSEAASAIDHDLSRIDAMVAGLVDVHRIRVGQRLALAASPCDLGAIAHEAVDELAASYGDRVEVYADPGVRGVWCADQLRRAIWNLAKNGLEHGAEGALVTVSVTRGREQAEVAVHNEGPEISPADLARLFRPFSPEGAGSHGPHQGWGLGLTLVWGCAEAHGGRVTVESPPSRGTTFTLVLPYDARPYLE